MLDIEAIVEEVKSAGYSKILIQVPEGLKTEIQQLSDAMDKADIEAIVDMDPCFGACDIKDREAKDIGCDAVLHLAHSKFIEDTCLPVLYHRVDIQFDPVNIMEKHKDALKDFSSVGLAATVQYMNSLDKLKEYLENEGKEVHFGKGTRTCAGQILGCDCTGPLSVENKVDCYIIITTGKFHPLGLSSSTKLPVFVMDPGKGELVDFTEEGAKLKMARASRSEWAKDKENFLVITSTKRGQNNISLARKVKEKLRDMDKNVYIIVADLITPSSLMGLKADCIVNCACPRMSEDSKLFGKTIVDGEQVLQW